MVCSCNGQRQCSAGSARFCEFTSLGDFILFTGNHQLAGTIQIREYHTRLRADFARWAFIETNYRRHAATSYFTSLLHEFAPLTHYLEPFFETHDSRSSKSRKFTQ